ncbi:hypothetical protein BLS_008762 [Venturia inaequalis]|uniref:Xylanolytic transcriptional activator regulatory domain-containing protein n=1 Tax=Venturia inaequalis TaxID=5025 RepID=A0A8H3V2X0_VENIN|nr:hypothetical protein BLS_008762 [Venturia inaequalis]
MESVYTSLETRALKIHERARSENVQHRAIIAFSGPPGSGKSTIAEEVVRRLNKRAAKAFAMVMSMDGFHLPRKTLDELPNREEAHKRRGVVWTFDAPRAVSLVERLHGTKDDRTVVISAPGFNHAEKDPVEDAIVIPGDISLVILEGLWLLYNQEPWNRISSLVDDTWFVDVDAEIARHRVAKRHIQAGIESNWDDAVRRASENDLVNGEEVRRKLVTPGIAKTFYRPATSLSRVPKTKSGKPCTFEALPPRTSLTRKNLDAAERKNRQLESLLRSIRPDLDVDSALQDVVDASLDSDANGTEARDKQPSPRSADEFEWHETALSEPIGASKDGNHIGDGMANTVAQEAGYLGGFLASLRALDLIPFQGNTSGTKLLQTISSLISPDPGWPDPAADTDAEEEHPDNLQTSIPLLSEQLATSAVVDLLVGHWLSAPEKEHSQALYYSAARSLFTIKLLEAGTLGTVQALLLMEPLRHADTHLKKVDRPNTGYNFVGIAYRMALGLGLHREAPTKNHGDILAHERRRQVFWTLYCFDSGFSITTGRPTTISDTFIDAKLPRNIDDHGASMIATVPIEVDFPTSYSAIIAQSRLAIIANRIHTISMSAQVAGTEMGSNLASTEESIDEWRRSLPPYFSLGGIPSWFRAPRAVLFWKEQNLRILLWQALERRPNLWPGKVESSLKCCTASLQAVFDICGFCRENVDLVHRGLSWYATYFLFQATLVLLLFEVQAAQESGKGVDHRAGSWTQGIAQARDCLTLLGKESDAAKRCMAVLRRIQSGALVPSPESSNSGAANLNGVIEPAFQYNNGQARDSAGLAHMLLQDEASPETAAIFGSDWSTAADPSLSTFLGDNSMQDFFQDFNGFPGTLEQNHFDYINYNMYNTGYQG